MLTRIRNGHMGALESVEVGHSRIKGEIARVLKQQGYVTDYAVEGRTKKTLRIYLKYDSDHEPVIRGLRRASRPGLRSYVGSSEVPRVLGGLGTAILSTSAGVMTGAEARNRHVGGEVICSVW